jgi:hypothetical protein
MDGWMDGSPGSSELVFAELCDSVGSFVVYVEFVFVGDTQTVRACVYVCMYLFMHSIYLEIYPPKSITFRCTLRHNGHVTTHVFASSLGPSSITQRHMAIPSC